MGNVELAMGNVSPLTYSGLRSHRRCGDEEGPPFARKRFGQWQAV